MKNNVFYLQAIFTDRDGNRKFYGEMCASHFEHLQGCLIWCCYNTFFLQS